MAVAFVAHRAEAAPTAAGASPARTTEASPEAPRHPEVPRVVLMLPRVGSESDFDWGQQVATALQAQGATEGLELEVRRFDPDVGPEPSADLVEDPPEALVWLLPRQGRIEVRLDELETERAWSRTIAAEEPGAPTAIEAVTNVSASMLAEVWLEESEVEAPEEPEPPVKEEQAEPPPSEKRPRLWFALGYTGNTFASSMIWHHGVGLELSGIPWHPVRVGVGYDVVIPAMVGRDGVEIELRRHPVSIWGTYDLRVARRLAVSFGLRATVDPVVRRSRGVMPQEVADPSLRLFGSLTPSIGLVVHLAPRIDLRLTPGAEVLVTTSRYIVEGASAPIAIAPHPVRFVVRLNLEIGALLRPVGT